MNSAHFLGFLGEDDLRRRQKTIEKQIRTWRGAGYDASKYRGLQQELSSIYAQLGGAKSDAQQTQSVPGNAVLSALAPFSPVRKAGNSLNPSATPRLKDTPESWREMVIKSSPGSWEHAVKFLRAAGLTEMSKRDRQTVIDYLQANAASQDSKSMERLLPKAMVAAKNDIGGLRKFNRENQAQQAIRNTVFDRFRNIQQLNFDLVQFYNAIRLKSPTLSMKGGEDSVSTKIAAQEVAKIFGVADYRELYDAHSTAYKHMRSWVLLSGTTDDSVDSLLKQSGVDGSGWFYSDNSPMARQIVRQNGLGIADDSNAKLFGRSLGMASSISQTIRGLAGDQRTSEELEGWEHIAGEIADNLVAAWGSGGVSRFLSRGLATTALTSAERQTARELVTSYVKSQLKSSAENAVLGAPGLSVRADDLAKENKSSTLEGIGAAAKEQFDNSLRSYDPAVLFDDRVPIEERFHNLLTLGSQLKGITGHVYPKALDAVTRLSSHVWTKRVIRRNT